MPYPCSPLTDYHRGHLDSDREGVSLMPHRRLVDSLRSSARKYRASDNEKEEEDVEDRRKYLRKRKRGDESHRESRNRLL